MTQRLGTSGDDTIIGDFAGDQIYGGPDARNERSDSGSDILYGGDGFDRIFGFGGNDYLYGEAGLDTLYGGPGNDALYGGAHNDMLAGGPGQDLLHGEGGINTATYSPFVDSDGFLISLGATSAVTVDLSLGPTVYQETFGAGLDGLVNIQNLTGSPFDDTLIGDDGANVLSGGDTAFAFPSTGHDRLYGGRGADTLMGWDGDDFLDGGPELFDDILDGGSGTDTASYASAISGVTVNLSITVPQNTGSTGNDTLISIENLIGSNYKDTLTGKGDDFESGTGGDNVLDGGLEEDTLRGGAGDDTYILRDTYLPDPMLPLFRAYDHVIEGSGQGIDTVHVQRSGIRGTFYRLVENVENGLVIGTGAFSIFGNALANWLTGNEAANTLSGGASFDLLSGLGRSDILTGGSEFDRFLFDNTALVDGTIGVFDRVSDFNQGNTGNMRTCSSATGITSSRLPVRADLVCAEVPRIFELELVEAPTAASRAVYPVQPSFRQAALRWSRSMVPSSSRMSIAFS
jgi:Ca2+-binding RTX toxin-like protein